MCMPYILNNDVSSLVSGDNIYLCAPGFAWFWGTVGLKYALIAFVIDWSASTEREIPKELE